jgi:hypothetical protein
MTDMNRRVVSILAFGALLLPGCLEREMKITSEPSGALVFISDKEVGRTPVTVPFTWYGDYDIILRLEGHQALKTHAQINAPIQEYPPLDLLSELAPWTIRDTRYLHYQLKPLAAPTEAELIKRAEAMEKKNLEPVGR